MRLCIAAFCIGLAAGSAQAAEAPGLWHKECETSRGSEARCHVEQFALAQPGNKPVLRVGFWIEAEGRVQMAATAPLGVILQTGMSVSVDESQPIVLPYERCSDRGCEVSAILDQAALEKFLKGKTLMVRYAVSDTLSADIPIQLDGLAAALHFLIEDPAGVGASPRG